VYAFVLQMPKWQALLVVVGENFPMIPAMEKKPPAEREASFRTHTPTDTRSPKGGSKATPNPVQAGAWGELCHFTVSGSMYCSAGRAVLR